MKYPVTVRDAQRIVERIPPYDRRYEAVLHALYPGYGFYYCHTAAMAALARLAAQYGPNHILIPAPVSPGAESSDRVHQIGTDEVAPQSENPSEDSRMHGGDSVSGEVEGGAHRQAPAIRGEAGDEPGQLASETGNTSEGVVTNPGGENGQQADALGERNKVSESAPPTNTDTPPKTTASPVAQDTDALQATLTDRANSQEDERVGGQPKQVGEVETSEKLYRYRAMCGGGRGQNSTTARQTHGGITAELKQAGIEPRVVHDVRRALARLVEGGESETGPRWDWQQFSERLLTARSVYPARREEKGRPAILILADVSNSCSGFSEEALIVAKAAAQIGVAGRDVIAVAHSNGYPDAYQINSGKVTPAIPVEGAICDSIAPILKWYDDLVRKFDIQAVVVLGDWDAEWLYHHFAQSSRVRILAWLDNWSCNVMPPTLRQDIFEKLAAGWEPAQRNKTRYVVGCKSATDFTRGLEIALLRR